MLLALFERFTERARGVVVLAQEEARKLKHEYIGTEHLLLGLLREDEGKGLAARVLESFELTLERVRIEVVRIVGSGRENSPGPIPFTAGAKRTLERSLAEALNLGHNYIGTEHLLLGLMREGDGVAAQILGALEVDAERVRSEMLRTLSGVPPRSRDPREHTPKRYHVPEWLRAPQGVLPGVLVLELLLARTAKVAIAIPRVYGYSQGFEIELRVISGPDGTELDSRLYSAGRAGRLQPDERGLLPPEMLRFAVQFADGSSADNTLPATRDLEHAPSGPVMQAQGGGGGAGNWRQSLWVWPLPSSGPVTFICEWPALGIALTRHQIEARQILDAAARAQVLFPHDHLPLPPWPGSPDSSIPNQPFIF